MTNIKAYEQKQYYDSNNCRPQSYNNIGSESWNKNNEFKNVNMLVYIFSISLWVMLVYAITFNKESCRKL